MIFDEHECDKDKEILELQEQKETLECKVREERNKNYRLQIQLIEALSKKPLIVDLPDASNPSLNEIEREEKDGVVIYRGHLYISKDDDDLLNAITNDAQNDRLFIRKLFEIVFGVDFLKQLCNEGKEKSKVLEVIESTACYHTMKALYEMRVFSNGNDDGAERYNQFKGVIRKKLNNVWQFQSSKSNTCKSNTSDEQNDTQEQE